MTIKELIETLQKYPEDTQVFTRYHSDYACTPDVDEITLDKTDTDRWTYGHDKSEGFDEPFNGILIGAD